MLAATPALLFTWPVKGWFPAVDEARQQGVRWAVTMLPAVALSLVMGWPAAAQDAQPAPGAAAAPRAVPADAAPPAAATDPLVAPVAALPQGAGVTAKVARYARRLIQRYDANGDGQLAPDEWSGMSGEPATIDTDADGLLSAEEIAQHVAAFGRERNMRPALPQPADASLAGAESQPVPGAAAATTSVPAPSDASAAPGNLPNEEAGQAVGNLPPATTQAPPSRRGTRFFVPGGRRENGLPEWFPARDQDGDGQLTLAEYAPTAAPAAVREFNQFDSNKDGVLTSKEYVARARPAGSAPATPKPAAKE